MLGKLAMSLLGGSSIGATLMYLFDPDQGPKHRKYVKRTAAGAYRGAAEAAAGAYDTAAESAASGWQAVRENAGPMTADWRARLSDRLADASRAVSPTGPDYGLVYEDVDRVELTPTQSYTAVALARHSRDLHGDAREAYARARDMYYDALIDLDLARTKYQRLTPAPKPVKVKTPKVKVVRGKSAEPDYLTISLVAAGCCALGAAAMFVFDPATGRRRRAVARDKAYSAMHRTGEAVSGRARGAARYVRDRGQGTVAQAKAAYRQDDASDAKLVARVRSEMGRVVAHPSHVEVTAVNGSVTLKGHVAAAEFDALMKAVYEVAGVREVVNQIETHVPSAGVMTSPRVVSGPKCDM